ncbi:hypothetical protein [Paracidobacterium acidisoli]|uniref:Lipocalin-like domain-containing protein n=1 Tax=Paracidobacterium acidisoli TaxID=2303751 RepID=A0A372IRP6_9BACT|nr:hypothetical protein [Paracidobacterium acidisoli]MBT9330507.1 hypothetical protein [Paracidobacterium acidisoli]
MKLPLRIALLFAFALSLSVSPFAAHAWNKTSDADWQSAKLLSFGMEHWISNGGSQTNGHVDGNGNYSSTTTESTWGHNTYHVVLDDGKMLYFAERTLSFRWQRDPHFTENAMVRFSLKKDTLTVVDDSGREFKMKLVKRRIKE